MKPLQFFVSILLSYAAGAIGSLATIPNIPTWYAALDKPFFNPPNWVFGPVWSVLYFLIGLSFYLVWTTDTKAKKDFAYKLFFIQLILNTAWSLIFFGAHQTLAAFLVIVALDVTIFLMIREYRSIRPLAGYLLIPYLLWVLFASCLNLAIVILN